MKYQLLDSDPKHRQTLYNKVVKQGTTEHKLTILKKHNSKLDISKAISYLLIGLVMAVAFFITFKLLGSKTIDGEVVSTQAQAMELPIVAETKPPEAPQPAPIIEPVVVPPVVETPATPEPVQPSVPVYAPVNRSHAELMTSAGIPLDQQPAADILIQRESSWNANAYNQNSGSCSLVQALPCSKIGDNWRDPVTALRWGNGYVVARYGTWQIALQHSYTHSWY